MLKKRKEEIEERKAEIAEDNKMTGRERRSLRNVPVRIRRLIKAEFGDKCAIPGCLRRAEQLHHEARFSLAGGHDPRFLAPLCYGHHQLAHLVDVRFEKRFLNLQGRGCR